MNHLHGIRAVSFDVGGTLIEPCPSVGHVYAEIAARHGVKVSPEILNERFVAAWKAKRNFKHGPSDWSELVDQTFLGLTTAPPSMSFFPEIYARFVSPDVWRIFDEVIPCLEELRRRGIRLAVISNWDERLRPLLQALKLDSYFEVIFVSVEAGCSKPDRAIFLAAAERLRLPPEAILHVGDNEKEDVAGAKDAGFRGLLVRGQGRSLTDLISD